MGKVIFGQFVHNFDIEPKEDLGPVIISCNTESINDVLNTSKRLRDVRENDNIYLVNTRIVPIPGTPKVLMYGDKVRYGKTEN